MVDSWVKLYRKIQDSAEWRLLNTEGKVVLITILLDCNFKETEALMGKVLLKLKPGQLVISRNKLAKKAGVSEQNVRTALVNLQLTGFLTKEVTNNKITIITIKNWKIYQGNNAPNQPDNQQPTGKATDNQPTPNQPCNSNKGSKTFKKERKEIHIGLFEYWNSFEGFSKLRSLETNKGKQAKESINARLDEKYTIDDLKAAIKNYSDVLRNDKQYYKHVWSFDKFFRQSNAFPDFLPEAKPHENWLRDINKKKTPEQERAEYLKQKEEKEATDKKEIAEWTKKYRKKFPPGEQKSSEDIPKA